nr:hypothetical protein [Segeticoccus rhizosphaerae]
METMNSTILRMGYQMASLWLTTFRTGYISRPIPTTARPEPIMNSTPIVIGALAVSPSTKAWINEVPIMAVTIWTRKRMPTTTAIILRGMTSCLGCGFLMSGVSPDLCRLPYTVTGALLDGRPKRLGGELV